MSKLVKLVLSLAAFGAFADAALAQSYPSRAKFLSVGIDCAPNLFARDVLGDPNSVGFLCVGQYPYLAQDATKNGFIALTVPTGAGTGSYASWYTFENSDGNAGFGLSDGGGVNGLTIGGDYEGNYTNVEMWELGSRFTGSLAFYPEDLLGTHPSFFLFGDPGGAPGSDTFRFVFENNANGCIFCPALLGSSVDQSGTLTFGFGTLDPDTGGLGPDTALSFTLTESTGAVTVATLDAPTVNIDATTFDVDAASDFSGNVNLSGSATLTVAGAISGSSGALVFNDDTEFGGVIDTNDNSIDDLVDDNVNVAADMSVVGDLNVTGTITGTFVGAGQSFGGWVDSAATGENLPSGWSASVSTLDYTVTHNLGLADVHDLAITCIPSTGGDPDRYCNVPEGSLGANSFVVHIFDTGAGGVNNDFFFTAVVVN